jgi:hypothetical protein
MPLEYLINGSNMSTPFENADATSKSAAVKDDPQKTARYDVESAIATDLKLKLEGQQNASLEVPEEGTIIDNYVAPQSLKGLLKRLATAGVELRGLEPVPLQERTHTKYYNIFTLFGGSFISLLP